MNRTPQAPRELIESIAQEAWARAQMNDPLPSCYFLGVRGYWPKSMGPTSGNDVGIWDDAIFFVSPDTFMPQQANTDPSRYGWNASAGKPMAVLQAGVWFMHRGPHKGKTPAFRQFDVEEARAFGVPHDGRMAVTRTYAPGDRRNYKEAGYYAINLHPGGVNGTSSEGCQTVPRTIANSFLKKAWDETKKNKVDVIPYILVEGPIN